MQLAKGYDQLILMWYMKFYNVAGIWTDDYMCKLLIVKQSVGVKSQVSVHA